MPDLDNRAPSLLEWVAQRVDVDLTEALGALAASGQRVQTDSAHLAVITRGLERIRVWERTWKLYDHTGIQTWIALDVEEENDLELVVRVNSMPLDRLVPPWIENRRLGLRLSAEAEADQRSAFYASVGALVRHSLAQPQTAA